MKREAGIKWLFLDLNSYFASVEQQENPKLRGKPVIVTPMDTDYTCAIAASYEAKAYGIKTGTMVKDAKKMCPNLHCVMARHDKYVAYHHRIIEEVIKHTPINDIWSIDELSSRLPPNKRNKEDAQKIAQKIKEGIWRNVGEAINCSIGFAPNSLLAKIACEMQKPDGLTILEQESLPQSLLHLELTDLPGIGQNMNKRLRNAGIHTMHDFWHIAPKHARKIWNSVEGERFWYLLHGYEVPKLATNTSMIGHSRILDPNLRRPDRAITILRKLLMKAATRMRNKGLYTRMIIISARTTTGQYQSYCASMPATQDTITMIQHIDILWRHIIATFMQNNIHKREILLIKKVSVKLLKLTKESMITDDLFAQTTQQNIIKATKNEALISALEGLQAKYQKDVVTIGMTPKTSAGYVGTKIAFSRVPETHEFWD